MIHKMKQKEHNQEDKVVKSISTIKRMRTSGINRRVTNVAISKKVVHEYFSIVVDSILAGYKFELNTARKTKENLGSIVIHKRMLKEGEMPARSYVTNKPAYNPYTIGEKYTIDFISEMMEKRGMVFKPSASIKKRLTKILYSNKGNYRLLN